MISKFKVEIHIGLTGDEQLMASTTSQNMITTLGMLELAKIMLTDASKKKPSNIVVPEVGVVL